MPSTLSVWFKLLKSIVQWLVLHYGCPKYKEKNNYSTFLSRIATLIWLKALTIDCRLSHTSCLSRSNSGVFIYIVLFIMMLLKVCVQLFCWRCQFLKCLTFSIPEIMLKLLYILKPLFRFFTDFRMWTKERITTNCTIKVHVFLDFISGDFCSYWKTQPPQNTLKLSSFGKNIVL